ncbi:MAG TPA: FAD-linked oxidase C-terminal domain-containing protein, partial [Thermoanaerobaculia bacterium]
LLVLGYPDVYTAADRVPEVLAAGPIGLEGLDDRLIGAMRRKNLHVEEVALLPEGGGWLLAEFGGASPEEAEGRARALQASLAAANEPPAMRLFADPASQRRIWEVRESGLGATAMVPGKADTWEGWEDSAVPPERVGAYLRDLRRLYDEFGYDAAMYGHFGQGCIHGRVDFDLTSRAGIDRFVEFLGRAAELVVSYGGSLSGEHGDGQARGALLPTMFGDELIAAFREFKAIWDPERRMNPGKLVDAYRPDDNLRLGVDYRPWDPATTLAFPEDGGSFARSALRCVGVGKCRRHDGGVMCPSYRVTLAEEHSTRGRARLLFEMTQREVIGQDGWRDESVKRALDLCLACKGCKGECPVHVDMAAYKAEFLSHYYAGRRRPRAAYAFGLVDVWARAAAPVAGLANLLTQAPGLSRLAKAIAGVAPERRIPRLARQTFRAWFARRAPRNLQGPRVLLWPDTFTNFFQPEIGRAAVAALEAAGRRVVLPPSGLCCGRPLYDHGMLDRAKGLLR